MTSITPSEAHRIVQDALICGVAGDLKGGAIMLNPLIEEGPRPAFALAAMLAEAASYIARRDNPGTHFGMRVEHVLTHEPGSVDDFSPDIKFAAQFVTAWANGDEDTAAALFIALVKQSGLGDGTALVDGLFSLFRMAVATATAVHHEERAARAGEDPTP
ncbi:hypothetical protein [Streptomyces sp. NRRL B-1347]|uniref:hypothetical protein n=1 Tax=Streptomyces sp. NRRL B-1347 TaxID=1476877 RepID=UPI0004C9EA7B|nr:hypothetical protein [Streptomyces sp. NRRL B-1347]